MGSRPVSGLVVAVLIAAQSGCGSSGTNQLLNAALSTGIAVASVAAARATTDACWGDCRLGTACDTASGTCQPLPCHATCAADDRCVLVDGVETCVRGTGHDGIAGAPDVGGPDEPAGKAAAADPCRGLCFAGETCQVEVGVASCVRAAP